MSTDNFLPLVQLYFDHELDTAKSIEVETHLLVCSECAAEFKRLQDLRTAIQGANLRFEAPAVLTRKAVVPVRRTHWLPVSLVAAACFTLLATSFILSGRSNAESQEVVANHVRSLLANHLIDVQSLSTHTVKPWLGSHLDFSPPVVDLTAEGYTLVGGRLDYLGGRNAAAIVYKHSEHTLNLFVQPGGGAFKKDSVRGYEVVEWSARGMHFLAVSDMNPAEMDTFVNEFRSKSEGQ